MIRLYVFVFLIIPLFNPHAAAAFEVLDNTTVESQYTPEDLIQAVPDFVKTPEGGLGWEVLAQTTETEAVTGEIEGESIISIRPEFPDAVKVLDGKTVVMQGFMFPLEQKDKQSRFLFGPFPISCPYHYHVGPSMVIEVYAHEPVTFSFEPLTLSGVLELVPVDDEYSIFYRMKDAVIKNP